MTVFLFAYKTGKIEPNQQVNWSKLVKQIYDKTSLIATEELLQITTDNIDNQKLHKFASDFFELIQLSYLCSK